MITHVNEKLLEDPSERKRGLVAPASRNLRDRKRALEERFQSPRSHAQRLVLKSPAGQHTISLGETPRQRVRLLERQVLDSFAAKLKNSLVDGVYDMRERLTCYH